MEYDGLVDNLKNWLLLPMFVKIYMHWDVVCVIIWNMIIISADPLEIIWMKYKFIHLKNKHGKMVDNYIIFQTGILIYTIGEMVNAVVEII